jgi:PhoD-like phosphatase
MPRGRPTVGSNGSSCSARSHTLVADDKRAPGFDQWDGYPAEREAFLDHLLRHHMDNVVVLSATSTCRWRSSCTGVRSRRPIAPVGIPGSCTSIRLPTISLDERGAQVSASSVASAVDAGFSSQIVWSSGMSPRSTARFITRTTMPQ